MVEVSLEPSHSTDDHPSHKMQVYILVIALLVEITVAGPLTRTTNRRANNQIVNYKTTTHSRHETGRPGYAVEGSYSYITTDGRLYKVTYQADERGFRAQGAHLPWSLPVYNTTAIANSSPDIQPLNVKKAEVVQIIQAVPEKTQKEENINIIEATKPEVVKIPAENINIEGQVNKSGGNNALETKIRPNATRTEEASKDNIVVEVVNEQATQEITQTEMNKDAIIVENVKEGAITPGLINTEMEFVKDENFVFSEEQSPVSGDEPTEKLTIHVPLIAKVYSLQKTTKRGSKPRETNGKTPRIIRYKLAYQPSWRNGENVLIPI